MQFHTSGWLGMAVVIYLVILIASGAAAEGRKTKLRSMGTFIGTLLACSLVVNAISFGIAHDAESKGAYATDAAQAFGLKSGKSYPLELGGRLGGTSLKATVKSGFFSAKVSLAGTPASITSVGFTNGSDSFILDLPTARVTFHVSDSAPHMVIIRLYDSEGDYGEVPETSGFCKPMIESGFAACRRVIVYHPENTKLPRDVRHHGLATIVQDSFDSAEITLSRAQYNQALDKNG